MTFTLALTPGEPAGIGPDLCIQVAQHADQLTAARTGANVANLVVIADPALLLDRARQLQLPLQVEIWTPGQRIEPLPAGHLNVLPVDLTTAVKVGQPDPANANYVLQTLRLAAQGCLDGHFSAMVTAPVHKAVINDAGIPFSGHTEFLADYCNVDMTVMMLATAGLRVALVTTHLPLRDVADAITAPRLRRIITILRDDLRSKFGIAQPRILVSGLNPHAGEGGHLGREELDVIIPVLDEFRQQGVALEGPLPADTLFTDKYLSRADAVLAMYHDQGLPVLKYRGFGRAANITLGLPIIRTSVDHGTALDLAGKGGADSGSLTTAIQTACEMATARSLSGPNT